jgi:hypothetical protein
VLEVIHRQEHVKGFMNRKTGAVRDRTELTGVSMGEQKASIESMVRALEETNSVMRENAEGTDPLQENAVELINLAESLNRDSSGGQGRHRRIPDTLPPGSGRTPIGSGVIARIRPAASGM